METDSHTISTVQGWGSGLGQGINKVSIALTGLNLCRILSEPTLCFRSPGLTLYVYFEHIQPQPITLIVLLFFMPHVEAKTRPAHRADLFKVFKATRVTS